MVTVIITTYKNEIYLPRAIESVLRQSYKNIEIIVVDDNDPSDSSRYATERVMSKYPQVTYIKHTENRNGASARNTGIAHANGKYLAFLDNDDVYLKNHIQRSVEALEKNPECDCVFSQVLKIRQGLCWELVEALSGDCRKKLLFSETALGTGSNLFVTVTAVRKLQGFDESFIRHQDVEFGLRLLEQFQAMAVNKIGILKEMGGFSNTPNFQRFLQMKKELWEKFRLMIQSLSAKEREIFFANQYHALLYVACKSGDIGAVNQIVQKLKTFRRLSCQERILVVFTRMRLFSIYEAFKVFIKKRKSGRLYRYVISELSEEDRVYFDCFL